MSYKIIKLNTGRNCLLYIIKAFSIEKIHIPYYLCPCIRSIILKTDCKIQFYHIDRNFRPKTEFEHNEFIFYPNYFGVCSNIVNELSTKYKNLIVDNAHSFYSEPKGIASFNSLRKFFPEVRDGAFLFTKKISNPVSHSAAGSSPTKCSILTDIIKDDFFYTSSISSYEEICKNENRLDKENIKYLSDCTNDKYNKIDHEELKNKKIKNFKYWHNILGNSNNLKLNLTLKDIPYGYPFLAKSKKDADKLVCDLKLNGIEIYRYWHNMPDNYEEKIFYTNLVVI